MFNELLNRIPKDEPDLKIGSLFLWVSGYNDPNQMNQGDLAYLNTPTLLVAEDTVVFSKTSDTPVFILKEFLKDIVKMYENISVSHVAEFSSHESEFSLRLTSNDLGHIKINVAYNAWTHDGRFEFEETLDQSYLPSIIASLKTVIQKFE
jgi:hypothetical protein